MRFKTVFKRTVPALAIFVSACAPEFDFDFSSLFCGPLLTIPIPDLFDTSARGELDHSTLRGECDETHCVESYPLGVGGKPELWFTIDEEFEGSPAEFDSFVVESDAPAVLAVQSFDPKDDVTSEEVDGECVENHSVVIAATLAAKAPGTAHLTIAHEGKTVDRYTLVVSQTKDARLELMSERQYLPDATIWDVKITEQDLALTCALSLTDDTGRTVYFPADQFTWTVEDPNVMRLFDAGWDNYAGTENQGSHVDAHVLAQGTTKVVARAPGVKKSFHLTVESVPPEPEPTDEPTDEEASP